MTEFETILMQAAGEMGITLSERQIGNFVTYRRAMLLWNRKISLVSLKSSTDLPIKHCIDSLTAFPLIGHDSVTLLDIGSGAGFPGIPLAIMGSTREVTLVDSSRKKTSFLRQVAQQLDLTGVTVVTDRIENLMHHDGHHGRYDVVISRATFGLPRYITMAAPFLSPGGTLIAMKGRGVDTELAAITEPATGAGLVLVKRHEINLPLIGDRRIILVFRRSH